MLSRVRTMVGPAYLFACLLLGGSAQGVWFNMLLQLAGLALIAWAAIAAAEEPLSASARQLLVLGAAAILFIAIQLVPLPPAIWTHLPGRASIAAGYSALAMPVPWEPLSLAPAASLDSLLGVIPPLAMFCVLVRLKAYRPVFLSVALVAGTIIGIGLGALQVVSSGGELSHWYLYPTTNAGRAVGFFANVNHMGTLLIIAIPNIAAIIAAANSRSKQRYLAVVTVAAGSAIVLLVGIALNGSLAAYGLAIPVAAASLAMLLPPASRVRPWLSAATALLFVGAIIALEASPAGSRQIGGHASVSVSSRAEILKTTGEGIRHFLPFGSGLGTFRAVYPLFETPARVDATYVIHAHDDYAELVLELGAVGVVLIILFLLWWGLAVWRVWSSAEQRPFVRAAAISSAAILVHSFVDYPLRTAAIATCFAMTLALLADSRGAAPSENKALRRKRHVEFR